MSITLSRGATDLESRLLEQLKPWVSHLRPFVRGEPVADSTLKYLAFDHMRRYFAVVIVSPEAYPSVVADNLERKSLAAKALGDLAYVVLDPLHVGSVDGLSFAIYPYCRTLSNWRGAWALQRLWIGPVVLSWLRRATEATLVPAAPQEIETSFAEPLAHLAGLDGLPADLRNAATVAVKRLSSGLWQPRFCMMHSDLWKGNILLAPGERRWNRFVLIDWGAAMVQGYPIFDLIRFSMTVKARGRRLRSEVQKHCRILQCEPLDARGYLLSALGYTGMNLNHFPLDRFLQMSLACWDHLNSIGSLQSG